MFHLNTFFVSILILFVLNSISYFTLVNSYTLPTPVFELLEPKGIRIWIPSK